MNGIDLLPQWDQFLLAYILLSIVVGFCTFLLRADWSGWMRAHFPRWFSHPYPIYGPADPYRRTNGPQPNTWAEPRQRK